MVLNCVQIMKNLLILISVYLLRGLEDVIVWFSFSNLNEEFFVVVSTILDESNRVILSRTSDDDISQYINASYVQVGYSLANVIVARMFHALAANFRNVSPIMKIFSWQKEYFIYLKNLDLFIRLRHIAAI